MSETSSHELCFFIPIYCVTLKSMIRMLLLPLSFIKLFWEMEHRISNVSDNNPGEFLKS